MALKDTIISIDKDNKQIKLNVQLNKMKLVYQIEDNRNDDLKNVFFLSKEKAQIVYDEKVKELE